MGSPSKFLSWHKNLKTRARKQGLPYALPGGGFLSDMWDDQQGRCALSGIEFLPLRDDSINSWNKATVDCIVPELGYVPGNVRLVLYYVNDMKGHHSQEMFGYVIKALAARIP